jgi:5-oxoprolinase (ATP-hydrolysing)
VGHIRDNAELGVRALLKKTAKELGCVLEAKDWMDDGSPIQLKVTITPEDGSAVFDFAGTGPEIRGCWNAPTSVCHAAIIYCLRA